MAWNKWTIEATRALINNVADKGGLAMQDKHSEAEGSGRKDTKTKDEAKAKTEDDAISTPFGVVNNWPAVSKAMKEKNYGFTADALQKKWSRLARDKLLPAKEEHGVKDNQSLASIVKALGAIVFPLPSPEVSDADADAGAGSSEKAAKGIKRSQPDDLEMKYEKLRKTLNDQQKIMKEAKKIKDEQQKNEEEAKKIKESVQKQMADITAMEKNA